MRRRTSRTSCPPHTWTLADEGLEQCVRCGARQRPGADVYLALKGRQVDGLDE